MKKKNILKEVIDDREDICNLYTRSNDAKQEIINLKRAIKNHGEAHLVLENEPCRNHGALEEDRERIEDLEGKSGIDRMISEEQGKRIGTLEGKYSRMDMAIMALAKERDERITTLEGQEQQHQYFDDNIRLAAKNFKEIWSRVSVLEAGRKDWSDATYTALRGRVEALEQIKSASLLHDVVANHSRRLAELEKEIKNRGVDYHAHARITALTNEVLKLRDAQKKPVPERMRKCPYGGGEHEQ